MEAQKSDTTFSKVKITETIDAKTFYDALLKELINDSCNIIIGFSTENPNYENSNNIYPVTKDNKNEIYDDSSIDKTVDYLLSKKRNKEFEKKWNIYKLSKLNKIPEEEKTFNIETKDKVYLPVNNIELNKDSVISIDSDISIPNNFNQNNSINNIIKNGSQKNRINVQNYYNNTNIKRPRNGDAIKTKREIVKEVIKNDMKSLGDIEKYIYREFKEYLKQNRDNFHLYNGFWDAFFAHRAKKGPVISCIVNGKKYEYNSHTHDLMILLFSIDGTLELYEKFLEDEEFHRVYNLKARTKYMRAFEIYRKNFHKIYCDKYKEADLELI